MARIFTPVFTSALILIVLLIVAVSLLAYFLTIAQADAKKANAAVATVNASTPGTITPASVYHNNTSIKSFLASNPPNLKVLCIGDSSVSQVSAATNFSRQSAFPKFLADVIYNKTGRQLSEDCWFGYDSTVGMDTKLQLSSNWYSDGTGGISAFGIGGYPASTTFNTSFMTYSPESTVTRVRVYLQNNSGNFNVFYNNSTSGTTIITANLPVVSGSVVVYTYTPSSQVKFVKIVSAGASNSTPVRIFGMCMDNGNDNVMVNAATDSDSGNWIGTAGKFSFLGDGLTTVAPNLVVIRLGATEMINGENINTMNNNITQLAKYVQSKNIQVLVVIPCWVGGSNDAAYITGLKSVLDTNSIPYYDSSVEFVDFNTQQTLGLTTNLQGSSSSITLSTLGNYRIASSIYGAFQ